MRNDIRRRVRLNTTRGWLLVLADVFSISMVTLFATILCNNRNLTWVYIIDALKAMPLLSVLLFLTSLLCGCYKCIWRYAGFKEYILLIISVVIACLVYLIFDSTLLHLLGVSTVIVTAMATMFISVLSRMLYAYIYGKNHDKTEKVDKKRTMVIGAGYTGKAVLEEIIRGNGVFNPVCVIDDDVEKIGRTIYGVEVVGNTNEIQKYVVKYLIDTIIFAIPSIEEVTRKNILKNCVATNCNIKVIPFISELIFNVDMVSQIQDVNIEDLLGRVPIKFEEKDIENYIKDSVVMITGGGGSIGSELVRQAAKYKAGKVVIVEIYENCAYDIQQEIWRDYGKDYPLFVEIANVTDYDKMEELYAYYKPNIIYNAAAHKHVPLMENNPEEAVKNNIYGTYNTAILAHKYKAKKFIMISTDKAVNPTNVMGATKRVCEFIVQYMAQMETSTEFASVRFGNVLGSNGSVIPLFREQIKKGGPVTVTHKDIIRYFMTIPEAVSLVMQAGAFAKGGEIFVLDMGSPIKIVALAENLITMLGYKPYEEIDIEFTGLRPGEKLYEELLMGEEGLIKTPNNKIFIGKQVVVDSDKFLKDLDELKVIAYSNNKENTIAKLREIAPTYVPGGNDD